MQSCLKAPVSPVSPVSCVTPSKVVAIYAAIIGLKVEESVFGINPAIEPARLIAALESPPRWTSVAWPPYPAGTSNDIKLLALAKLEAFFAIAEGSSNRLAGDFQNTTSACLLSAEPAPLAPPREYIRYRVRAHILTNGDPVWSYEVAASEKSTPAVESERQESDRGVFLQNLVRADLQRRIARRQFIVANRPQMGC